MVFFITVLRALAACLITNSHYTGIYPTDLIANGGLLGDIIFFAVSGYCLYNVKGNFFKWYGKRLLRIYPVVILITIIYMFLGFYSLKTNDFFWWFIYPTNYHFLSSIVVLYIPYYVVMKIKQTRENIPMVMIIVLMLYIIVYVFIYDKSYYHIDTVIEPMIWFLYFESMLLGVYFKSNDQKFRNKPNFIIGVIGTVVSFVGYFASKLLFSSYPSISSLQIVNQLAIFTLLFCMFRLFASIDSKLEKMPKPIKKVAEFLAKITLEIYVVQIELILLIRPHLSFPINWLAITASILIAAFALHLLNNLILKAINKIFEGKTKKQNVG